MSAAVTTIKAPPGTNVRARSVPSHSSSPTRPHNLSSPSSKMALEDKEHETPHDTPDANILDVNSASIESLDETPEVVVPTTKSSLDEIDADPELLLLEKEPDTWVET